MTQLIALKQTTITTSVRDLGEFTIKSDAIRFTDPCYGNDTWCKGSMPAVNGQWQAKLGFFRDPMDANSLINHINQLNYILACYQKFKNLEERNLWGTFGSIVSQARDHKNGFQKISRLYELINEYKDETEKLAFKNYADEAVAFFDPLYTNEKEQYWEKDFWLLFELASAFQYQHQYTGIDEAMCSLIVSQLQLKADDGEISQEDVDKKVQELNARSIKRIKEELEKSQKAYDDGKPRRVQYIHIKHESIPQFTPFDQELWIEHNNFNVGVDSGQAGFFDEAWFEDYGNERKDDDRSAKWEKIYDMLGELSLGKYEYDPETGERVEYNYAGTFEFGCNGQTAHGDGSAPLYYRTDADGKVIEAVYHYDIAYDEEDEEELA